jgi:hypothetical protein
MPDKKNRETTIFARSNLVVFRRIVPLWVLMGEQQRIYGSCAPATIGQTRPKRERRNPHHIISMAGEKEQI